MFCLNDFIYFYWKRKIFYLYYVKWIILLSFTTCFSCNSLHSWKFWLDPKITNSLRVMIIKVTSAKGTQGSVQVYSFTNRRRLSKVRKSVFCLYYLLLLILFLLLLCKFELRVSFFFFFENCLWSFVENCQFLGHWSVTRNNFLLVGCH